MKRRNKLFQKYLILFITTSSFSYADSFENNFYNNHGTVGLINIPTARFYNEGVHGISLYDGTPDSKITLTSSPYDWMEASFFYTNIDGLPYCSVTYDPVCGQDHKDKGFNIKIRLKNEGYLPAIAIGLNDLAGTGYYNSEYIVSSYGIKNIDLHFGLGWGQLNGNDSFKNPLSYISDRFLVRPTGFTDSGGSFNPDKYFSGPKVSPFFGISYHLKEKIFFNFEKDPTLVNGRMPYPEKNNDYSYGINYKLNDNFIIGLSLIHI